MARKTKEEREAEFQEFCEREFHRSRAEEWANGISHMIGVVFGIVALVMMVVYASIYGTACHVVSCSIYGATIIMLTLSSTLYHLFSNYRVKRVFQIFDHCTIYFLIAGSYMPFALVTMGRCAKAWVIFGVEWGLTLVGVLIEVLWPKIVNYASLPIYLVMGWMIALAFRMVVENLPTAGLVMLVVGGVVYTLGVIFYVMDHTPYMHTIWHVFVLGGIVCQWVCVMFHVIPRG